MTFESWFQLHHSTEGPHCKKMMAAAWAEALRQFQVPMPSKATLSVMGLLKVGQQWQLKVKGGVHESTVWIQAFDATTVSVHESVTGHKANWRTHRIDDLDFLQLFGTTLSK